MTPSPPEARLLAENAINALEAVCIALRDKDAELRELQEAVDVELGRHLCYTGDPARRRFWAQVEARLAASSEEPG